MSSWWARNVVEAGKLPLALCLLAFVVTFLATRVITRMIRAGIGPFRDNVTESGTHVHHAVPGLGLLIAGAVTAVATRNPAVVAIAALLIGAGASLVLDEFALILHLQDVYWEREGRASVQAVALATMCIGLVLLGASPLGVADVEDGEGVARWVIVAGLAITALCVLVCGLKGKRRLIVVAVFVPVVAFAGAVRLARPGSWWFRRRYADGGRKQRRAAARGRRWDAVDPAWTWLADLVAGAPSSADAAPPERTSDNGAHDQRPARPDLAD